MNSVKFSENHWIYLVTFSCSILFSSIAILCEPYLNNDGIFYIDAANVYLRDGFASSLKSYPWPFYSILIGLFHQMTGVPILIGARLINVLIISFTCVLFVKIYHEITNHKGNLWVACFLILTLTGINKYRDDVLRDFGYWCFALIGFLYLIYYLQKARIGYALVWQFTMLFAFLFRVEAVALIILGPFAVSFSKTSKNKVIEFFSLYSLYILIMLFLGAVLLFISPELVDISSTRLRDLIKYANLNNLVDRVFLSIRQMGDIFWYDGLNIEKNYGTLLTVLATAMVTYCIINIASCISFPFAILTVYGIFKNYVFFKGKNLIILYFIIIQFIVLMVFLSQKFLLVPRYTTVLVFLLLIYTGQIAEVLIDKVRNRKNWKAIYTIFILLILAQTGDNLITFGGYSKNHIVTAGLWVKEHIESSQPLFSSDLKAVYYADRKYLAGAEIPTDMIFKRLDSRKFAEGTHIIIDGKDEERETLLGLLKDYEDAGRIRIIKEITNKENDWALVVKVEKSHDENG